MAKKRLNKRVVIVLAVLAGICLIAAGTYVLRKLPKDAKKLAQRGATQFAAGNYLEAIEAYRKATKADRENPEYQYKYALALYSRAMEKGITRTERDGNIRTAIRSLQVALLRNPEHLNARQLLCDMYWTLRMYSQYSDEAAKLLKLAPDDAKTYLRRGMVRRDLALRLRDRASIDATIADFKKAAELEKDNIDAWAGWIDFYQRLKLDEYDAGELFLQAIQANPNVGKLRAAYASYLSRNGFGAEAREQIDLAIANDPDDPIGYIELASIHRSDKTLDKRVAIQKALDALNKAKEIDDADARIYLRLADLYQQQGAMDEGFKAVREGLAAVTTKLMGMGEGDAAPDERAALLLEAARLQLNHVLADMLLKSLRADLADREDRLQEVRGCIEKLSAAAPDAAQTHKLAGHLAYIEKRYSDARTSLETAHEKNPRDPQVTTLLANLYLLPQFDLPGKAEQVLNEFRQSAGVTNHPSVLLALAKISLRTRDYVKAEQLLVGALRGDPENKEIMNLLLAVRAPRGGGHGLPPDLVLSPEAIGVALAQATMLAINQEGDKAIGLLENLYRRTENNPKVLAQLLAMYESRNQLEKIARTMDQAIQANPDNEVLRFLKSLYDESDPEKRFQLLLGRADQRSEPYQRALDKAILCLRHKRTEEFLKYLRQVAAIKPDAGEVVALEFHHAMSNKDWGRAEELVRQAAAADLDGAGGHVYAAKLARQRNQFDQAISELLQVSAIRPANKAEQVLLGECYLNTNEIAKAEQVFQTLVSGDPGYLPAVVGMAKVTELQADWESHKSWVWRARGLGSRDPYITEQFLVTRELEATGTELDKIIQQRQNIHRQNPQNLRNVLNLARLYRQTEQIAQAEELYRFYYDNVADKLIGAEVLSRFYVMTNRSSEADKILNDLIERHNDKVGAYVLYGNFLSNYNHDQAGAAYKQAVLADPQDWRGHLATARFRADEKNWEAAVASMNSYLRLQPSRMGEKQLANLYMNAGRFADAATRLDKLLGEDPSDMEALNLKGLLARQRGDLAEAEQVFTQALQINRNYVPALVNRAMVYSAAGEFAEAQGDLKEAIRLSTDPNIVINIAKIHIELRDFDDAEAILSGILERQPNSVIAIDLLIGLYMRQQKWPPLEALLVRAKKMFPNPKYWLYEAEMHRLRNQMAKVLATVDDAAKVFPNSVPVIRARLEHLLRTEAYDQVLVVALGYRDHAEAGLSARAFEAVALAKLNRPAQADSLFLSVIKDAPSNQLRYVIGQIGRAYGQAGAIAKLTGWIDQRTTDRWMLQMLLGDLHANAKDVDRAASSFAKALELAENDSQKASINAVCGAAYQRLASALPEAQAYPLFREAEKAYLEVLKTLKNNPTTLNNLAYLLANSLNEPQRALAYAERAVELAPNADSILDTYAWTLAKLGKFSEAERFLARALQAERTLPEYRYHLGYVYEQTGRLEAALKQYEQAFAMIGNDTQNRLFAQVTDAMARLRSKLNK